MFSSPNSFQAILANLFVLGSYLTLSYLVCVAGECGFFVFVYLLSTMWGGYPLPSFMEELGKETFSVANFG